MLDFPRIGASHRRKQTSLGTWIQTVLSGSKAPARSATRFVALFLDKNRVGSEASMSTFDPCQLQSNCLCRCLSSLTGLSASYSPERAHSTRFESSPGQGGPTMETFNVRLGSAQSPIRLCIKRGCEWDAETWSTTSEPSCILPLRHPTHTP